MEATIAEQPHTKVVVTYSGALVGRNFGVPTVYDIAVQSMRQCRWSGAVKIWWPVGMHALLTADICIKLFPPDYVVYALLHDAAEAIYCDVPGPLKAKDHRDYEHRLLRRIYQSLNVPQPTEQQSRAVVVCDMLALLGEAVELGHQAEDHVVNSRVNKNLVLPSQVELACKTARRRIDQFNPLEAINPLGRHVVEMRDMIYELVFPKGLN